MTRGLNAGRDRGDHEYLHPGLRPERKAVDDDGAIQFALPFDRPLAHSIDSTLDVVRERFG